MKSSLPKAEVASWYGAVVLLTLILLTSSVSEDYPSQHSGEMSAGLRRPCDEIYVVGDGETLHTISEKCGDPFIVEKNPHIHDPDDVFPGLVIKIASNSHF